MSYRASSRPENQGLGVERPEDVTHGDDEYDAYRKRMMLAYRFRPNPLVCIPLIFKLIFYI
jgi:splicing factor 4